MYRVNDIKTGLLHLVGWRQSYDPQSISIDNSLTESLSGIYFQQAHPLLTIQNLQNIAPDFTNISYGSFDEDRPYNIAEKCVFNGAQYKALKSTKGNYPTNTEYWITIDPFSEWLEDKTKDSITNAISRFITNKMSQGVSTLLENKFIFDGGGRISDKVINENALVGFEIVPIRSRGITTKINKIGLQFSAVGNVKLYLMHSSSSEPIQTITLEVTKPNAMQWFSVTDLFLPYVSSDVDAGGSWYLVYNQSELENNAQAIYKDRDWSKGPCNACSRIDYTYWQLWSKYIELHPLKVSGTNKEYNDANEIIMWDAQNNLYTYLTNYGINLEVSVMCDITDVILEQKMQFKDVVSLQVATDLLREMAYNPNSRINRSVNSGVSKMDILYALDGDSTSFKKSGLMYTLELAYKALNINLSGIDRVCIPCKNGGIKYRTV